MKRLAALLALALPLAASAGVRPDSGAGLDAAYAPRRVALVIGVDSYADPALQSLSFAGKDALDMADVLRRKDAGGYDEVHVLTGAAATTRRSVEKALDDVTATLHRDDTFLLYISGHGTLELDPLGTHLYFLPSDGQLDHADATAIPVDWLEHRVDDVAARRRVLILDTCHNGRSKSSLSTATSERLRSLKGDPPPPRSVADVSESEARLYAAEYYQPAMEDKNLQNGVYTHFLLQALTTARDAADLDGDGLVDVVEAHDYARDGTIRYTGGMQVPRAEYKVVGHDEIYLSGDVSVRRSAERALVSAYEGLLASARLLVDGTPRGALPGVVAVEPGRHRLRVEAQDGTKLADTTLKVVPGQHISVEDLLDRYLRRPSLWTTAGVVLVHDNPLLPKAMPEVELGLDVPVIRELTLSGHLRTALGVARPGDLDEATNPVASLPAVGLWVGFGADTRRFAVGPEIELATPLRTFGLQGHDLPILQISPSPTVGARARANVRISDATSLVLRYDVRVVPYRYDGAWTSAFAHGASVGLAF